MIKTKPGKLKIGFSLFLILLVLMPMHTLVFSKLLADIKILSLWRDVLIVVLVISTLRGRTKNYILDISILVAMSVIICYAFFAGGYYSLNTARMYCIPLLIYFYARNRSFSQREFDLILRTFILTTTAIAVWGILQAFFLGPEIMFRIGYDHKGDRFAASAFYMSGMSAQQRVIGTFSSPNGCGAYFAVMIVILICFRERIKHRKLFWSCIATIAVGLIGTFSRSAWIGCLLGVLFFNCKRVRITRKTAKYVCGGVIIIIVALAVFSRTELYHTMYSMFTYRIGRTVSGEDASFRAHVMHLYKPVADIIKQPLGLGFATNGSVASAHLPESQIHFAESSLWVMAFEIGIPGLIIYYFPYVYTLLHFGRRTYNKYAVCAAKTCLCTLMTFLVLPAVQNYEAPFYVMLFAGIAMNKERELVSDRTMSYSPYYQEYKTVM